MTTLAELMILSGGDNRPPMLEKPLYDSWKSRMELYMQNREHGRMILESVEHGPLIWPTIEENGVTRTKKYAELSATEKIQADCDIKATNIILQGHHRMSIHSLPPEWSKFKTNVKLVRDLHTTNFDQLNAYLEQHELHANEVLIMRKRNQDPLTLVIDSGLAVLVFKQGDDPIDAINKMMSFLSTIVTSCFPSTNNQLRNSSNPRQQATIHDGRVTVQPVQGRQSSFAAGESHMARQCPKAKRKRDATWFKDKVLLVEAQGSAYQVDDLDAYDSDYDEISTAKAVLMANLSKNEITSDSNIIPYSQYLLETQNAAVHDTNYFAQQDAMILSMFEQLSNQVTNCNKVNKDNLIANVSLSVELERYKERDKNAQFADFEKEINSIKQTLSEQLNKKGTLKTTFNVLKNESKEKEAKNIDKEIALEKKVKELDNIVFKMGQSAQTVHMLMKPQVFYDNNLKQALGFQNPFCLKKAQQIRPMLYDGTVIVKETNVISIADLEETLMIEEESQFKMILKQNFGKCFVPHQELSDEQDFWLQTSHPNTDQYASSPVKIEAPRELPKCFEIQKKQFLIENDRLLDQIISQDIVNIAVNSSVDMNTSVNVNSSIAMNDYVNYVEKCNKCLKLEDELFKQHNMVEKDEYNKLSKSFSKLKQHCISLELAMQLNKEIFQKNNTSVNQTEPTFNHLFELNNLKAELQAKDTTIEKLKTNIKHLNKTSIINSVKKDTDEIETIYIELEHKVAKLIVENEHLKQTFKQLYDSIKPSREKVFVITALKNDLRKLKGKGIVDNVAHVSNATTIAPGMYKLDPVTMAPKEKNNREAHIYKLKHTMEQAAILREIVEQAKSLNPLDSASYSACKYVKLIQELLGYVRDTCPDIDKPSKKLVAVMPINKKKIVSSMFDVRHELCFLEFVYDMNTCSKSMFVKKAKKKKEWKPIGKVFTKIGYNWKPTGIVAQEPVVTKVYTRRPKINGSNSKPKIAKSMISNKTEPGTSRGSNTSVAPPSSSLVNDRLSKLFSGLWNNLFSVGQLCDSDLEVAFRKHTCFVRKLESVDLLAGSREANLYTLSIGDMMASSPICHRIRIAPRMWSSSLSSVVYSGTTLSTLEVLEGLVLKILRAITLTVCTTFDSRMAGVEFEVTGLDKAFILLTLGRTKDFGKRVTE
ncbi:hypothetical protein Tco_0492292 [Tanacetum coccineum]